MLFVLGNTRTLSESVPTNKWRKALFSRLKISFFLVTSANIKSGLTYKYSVEFKTSHYRKLLSQRLRILEVSASILGPETGHSE